MNTKKNIVIAAVGMVLIAGVAFSVRGGLFKGSFDVKDAENDVHITAFALDPVGFNVLQLAAEKQTITYTLDKHASNLFLTMSGKDKKMKVFALSSSDMTKGSHTMTLRAKDFPQGYFEIGQSYELRLIAYNSKQEISDFKTITAILAAAPKPSIETTINGAGTITTTNTDASKGIHKTTIQNPSRPAFVQPASGAVIDVSAYKDAGRVVLTWTDESNKKSGARQSDAQGNFMMNYRWKLMQGKVPLTMFDQTEGVKGASANWTSEFPSYESGGDTPSSSSGCIVSMKSDGSTEYSPRWTCTQAVMPYSVLNGLTDGDYTVALQAGDGINASSWIYRNVILKNTEATQKALEAQQDFLDAEKKGQEILLSIAQENGELANLAEAITVEQKSIKTIDYGDQDEITATYRVSLKSQTGFAYRKLKINIYAQNKLYKSQDLVVSALSLGKMVKTFFGLLPQIEADGSVSFEVKIKISTGLFSSEKYKQHPVVFDFDYIDKEGVARDLTSRTQTIVPALAY